MTDLSCKLPEYDVFVFGFVVLAQSWSSYTVADCQLVVDY